VANVSGTLAKTKIRTKEGTITRRVVASVRNGKQRIYIREDKPRTRSVFPTNGKSGLRLEGPVANARFNFGRIAAEVAKRMADGDTRPRKVIWAAVKKELSKKTKKQCPK
jgi:hypothetical protein